MVAPDQVPALKEGSHPIPTAWRQTLRDIVGALAAGDYSLLADIAGVIPLNEKTARQVRDYISDYGATLIQLPDETWRGSVAQWRGGHWEFTVDLWTLEEGQSDLVLLGQVRDSDAGYTFEIGLVYVP